MPIRSRNYFTQYFQYHYYDYFLTTIYKYFEHMFLKSRFVPVMLCTTVDSSDHAIKLILIIVSIICTLHVARTLSDEYVPFLFVHFFFFFKIIISILFITHFTSFHFHRIRMWRITTRIKNMYTMQYSFVCVCVCVRVILKFAD